MNNTGLKGKIVLITGANNPLGIGSSSARVLEPWTSLIEHARIGRHNPGALAFIRFSMGYSRAFST
jgi:hypothetical protein